MFVDLGARPGARLQRALAARNLTSAEQAAFEIACVSLEQARELSSRRPRRATRSTSGRRSRTSAGTWTRLTRR